MELSDIELWRNIPMPSAHAYLNYGGQHQTVRTQKTIDSQRQRRTISSSPQTKLSRPQANLIENVETCRLHPDSCKHPGLQDVLSGWARQKISNTKLQTRAMLAH